MASKPAPTMAHKPKPDRFSNPLLIDPAIHADLKPLFDAVVMVSVWSRAIACCYPELLVLKDSRGLPKAEEWPDSPELERNRAQHAEWVKAAQAESARKGESVVWGGFLEPRWTVLMREWSGYYRDWCAAIATAKQAAESPAVAAIMDAGEVRPSHRWTMQTILDLDKLAGTLHPIRMGGVDGLGFIRCGLPPLPQDFRTHAEAVHNRIGELRSIPVSAVPPTPTVSVSPELLDRLQRAAAAVDPGAIDRVAERTAEKVARVLGGGNGAVGGPARTEVVLWEGAAHTDRNIRLARTRSAYLEAHGDVVAALAALKADGNEIARRTFYNHLDALDTANPHWRDSVQLCNEPAQMHGTRIVGTRGKSRGKAG